MKHTLLLAAIFLLTVPLVGVAQFDGSRGSFPGCPTCGVYSYVDLPAPEVTVSTADFVITGWGFECYSGEVANRVSISYQTYEGIWVPLPQPHHAIGPHGGIDRRDVQLAYRPFCPNVPTNTGWQLTVTNPPPLGLRRVQINVWRGPYYEAHRRTYLIVP